jgi:hypothetical protein
VQEEAGSVRTATARGRALVGALGAALVLAGCGPVQRLADAVSQPSDAELLAAVSLTEQDAGEGALFQPYEGGDQVYGEVSLDLCYGDFPSEDLRSGRNQVAIGDAEGQSWVSSEAILYPTPADAQQAMSELAAARESCPSGPVDSPKGDREPLAWEFTDAPDDQWPEQPGVARQSYAFTVTDPTGVSWSSTATYLQRGRMILALYATPPDSPSLTLRNAPDDARFVDVMSRRLSGLPEDALQQGDPLADPRDIDV